MWKIFLVLFVISVCIFAWIMVRDSRTLWSGVSFFWMMVWLAAVLFFLLAEYAKQLAGNEVLVRILVFLFLLTAVCVMIFPAALILTFFVEGIRVIRHEGMKPSNLLSMLFSLLLFAYLAVWPLLGGLESNTLGRKVYVFISFCAVYLLSLMAVYVISAILNLIHFRKRRNADYIIVLGAMVMGTRVPALLAARIQKGIDLLRWNPNAVLIMSGGQGPGEELAEGEAMAAYAVQRGVERERILIEGKSRSTEENLRFSRELMDKEKPRIIVVTTAYHVFRALILARQQRIKCVGFGARTKWYFTLNALLREFMGYLSLTWKRHGITAVILAVILAVV